MKSLCCKWGRSFQLRDMACTVVILQTMRPSIVHQASIYFFPPRTSCSLPRYESSREVSVEEAISLEDIDVFVVMIIALSR